MQYAYPVMLDVAERLTVIVGGGRVAVRKARGLLDAGATRIRVIAPTIDPEMPPGVRLVPSAYRPEHLDGAQLVFAATDAPDVNDAVVRDARARGVLVARADADDEHPGDFATPALFRQRGITVTISAGSPALAAFIRDQIAARFDPLWAQMADAMQILRPAVLACPHLDIAARAAILRDLATTDALEALARGGLDELRSWLIQRHPALKGVV